MKVTVDRYRILHLVLLLACSCVIGQILISKWEWGVMSAYGFATTITIQISNALYSLNTTNGDTDEAEKKREEKRERRREHRNQTGHRKKK